jgi:hypothetical protein
MDLRDIAVGTITLARTSDEADAMQEALQALAAADLPIAIADGGSPEPFVRAVAALPRVSLVSAAGEGLVGQVRASLAHARSHATGWLLYTEPDKRDFFAGHLDDFLRRAEPADGIGVILASRSPASFETYPPVQQYTETVANRLCADATGLAADFMYGPFLLSPRLLPFLDDLPASVGWGWRPFVFGLARRIGLGIASIEGDYVCPPDQRLGDEAERLHRMRQLSQNVDGLVRSATTRM